jgi:hypothetical protein
MTNEMSSAWVPAPCSRVWGISGEKEVEPDTETGSTAHPGRWSLKVDALMTRLVSNQVVSDPNQHPTPRSGSRICSHFSAQ